MVNENRARPGSQLHPRRREEIAPMAFVQNETLHHARRHLISERRLPGGQSGPCGLAPGGVCVSSAAGEGGQRGLEAAPR